MLKTVYPTKTLFCGGIMISAKNVDGIVQYRLLVLNQSDIGLHRPPRKLLENYGIPS